MILDTNALSALLMGDQDLKALISAERELLIPAIVLGEYRFGLLQSRERARLESALEQVEARNTVLAVDRTTARHYAEIRLALKKLGRPIPENDIWISALAKQHARSIVSRDAHFRQVPELVAVSW